LISEQLNRTKQNRTAEQNRTEQNRTEQNRTEQNRTEQNINLWEENCDCVGRNILHYYIFLIACHVSEEGS
jgi:hypothetical protein